MHMKKNYNIIDWHCDVLLKLYENPSASFLNSPLLDVNYEKLQKGNIKVQAMALFIDPEQNLDHKYEAALEQVDIFKKRVLTHPNIVQIRNFNEIDQLKEHELGVFLTLEGLDCVGSDIRKVEHLLDEGVLSIGMTWNDANLACDGIGEPRGAGLSSFGYQVVELMNARNLFIDVSHISLKGFEDVLNNAKHVIASHSNAKSIAKHRRNLSDNQIRRMKERGFPIHLVFYDIFVSDETDQGVSASELFNHVDHFVSLGVEDQLGFGSDFDGISSKLIGLEDASCVSNFMIHLASRYGETFAQNIAHDNFMNYVRNRMVNI